MNEVKLVESTFVNKTEENKTLNHAAVAIESDRAVAEAKGRLFLAKNFPRDINKAHAEFMEACGNLAFAESAFYSVPNRGSGPSIRFAEECARCYGNFIYGHKELSRAENKSEIEVYAWDVQQNNISSRQITVMHIQDLKDGKTKRLILQADIDNKIANVASKQMRGRILALVPKWIIADGIQKCKATIENGGGKETIAQRIRKMLDVFKSLYNVSPEMIEQYLGRKTNEITSDNLFDLQGVFNAIREGAKPSEYFGKKEEQKEENNDLESAIDLAKKSFVEKKIKKDNEKQIIDDSNHIKINIVDDGETF